MPSKIDPLFNTERMTDVTYYLRGITVKCIETKKNPEDP